MSSAPPAPEPTPGIGRPETAHGSRGGLALVAVLFAFTAATCGLIGYDLGGGDDVLACDDPAVTLEDARECTVPARKGAPADLPGWAADELIDLRVRALTLQKRLARCEPGVQLVPPTEGDL